MKLNFYVTNPARQDRLLGCKRSSSSSSISTHSTSARFCLVISSRVSVALRQNAAGWAISQSALRDIPFAPAVDGNCFWMRFAPRLPRRGPPSRSAPLDVPPALMASWTLFRAWDSFKQQKRFSYTRAGSREVMIPSFSPSFFHSFVMHVRCTI
jgi:hypothetical protein